MIRFETLLEKVRSYSPEADLELLRRAYVFSALEHKGQVRHSGEPYLVHPLEVADSLADMKLDVVAVAAGLLHDVVEDTLTTPERIQELFGKEIAHVVEGVTKIGAIPFSSSEERQAENFRKMLLAMVDDIRVILVKLADRLHNMRTLHHLPEERRIKIAQETLDIYAPIANRLGMSKVKNELEELSFNYLEPKAYEGLRTKVEARAEVRRRRHRRADEDTARALDEAQIPINTLDGRIKRLYSIHLKLMRQQIDLERVYDFVALRLITQSVKDCYAALGIIHQTWSPVPGRFKDFIAMPRPNGYQSLHTSVISEHGIPFEVQIRTEEMHRRAEEGIAAHWKYKEGRVGDHRDERYFQWMRQLLEVQKEVRDPAGVPPEPEDRPLPRGGLHLHAERRGALAAARCHSSGLRVRSTRTSATSVWAPASTAGWCHSAPAFRTVTSSRSSRRAGHKPSRDWLSFVVTSRARSKIKHVLQGEERTRSIDLGRRLFDKEARRFGLNPGTLLESAELAKFASEYGAKSPDELLAHIGYGKLAARTVLQKSAPTAQLHEDSAVVSVVRRVLRPGCSVGQDQGARHRRCDGVPREVLQSDPRRAHRRLHHARQGRVGARCELSQRPEPDVRSRASDRRRVGQRRHRSGALHRSPDDAGRRSQGHAR